MRSLCNLRGVPGTQRPPREALGGLASQGLSQRARDRDAREQPVTFTLCADYLSSRFERVLKSDPPDEDLRPATGPCPRSPRSDVRLVLGRGRNWRPRRPLTRPRAAHGPTRPTAWHARRDPGRYAPRIGVRLRDGRRPSTALDRIRTATRAGNHLLAHGLKRGLQPAPQSPAMAHSRHHPGAHRTDRPDTQQRISMATGCEHRPGGALSGCHDLATRRGDSTASQVASNRRPSSRPADVAVPRCRLRRLRVLAAGAVGRAACR
jgi:hypothetical protein